MIKHIVMWNVRGATPDQRNDAIRLVKSGFEGLVGRIPGLLHLEVGLNTSGVDYACDVVLYTEFASQRRLTPMPRTPNTCACETNSVTSASHAIRWITPRIRND